jgi:hypothetical protein
MSIGKRKRRAKAASARTVHEDYRAVIDNMLSEAGVSQADLAKALGIDQSTVSAWGRRDDPSRLMLAKLTEFALEHNRLADAEWFAGRLNLSRRMLLSLAKHGYAQLTRPTKAGEVIRVPVNKVVTTPSHGATLPYIPVPIDLDRTGIKLSYVRAEESLQGCVWPFNPGDLLIVDSSETDLRKLAGRVVAAYRSREQADRLYSKWLEEEKGGHAKLGNASPSAAAEGNSGERRELAARHGLFIGELVAERAGTLRLFNVRFRVIDPALASPVASSYAMLDIKAGGQQLLAIAEATNAQRPKLEEGITFLGEVVGWLSPRELPHKVEKKK